MHEHTNKGLGLVAQKQWITPEWRGRGWALPAEHLGGLLNRVCPWPAVTGGHVAGRCPKIILRVGGAARAPHLPPPLPLHLLFVLHGPLTGQAGAKHRRKQSQELRKINIHMPKSTGSKLAVYWKSRLCLKMVKWNLLYLPISRLWAQTQLFVPFISDLIFSLMSVGETVWVSHIYHIVFFGFF